MRERHEQLKTVAPGAPRNTGLRGCLKRAVPGIVRLQGAAKNLEFPTLWAAIYLHPKSLLRERDLG
jgi:hypothetical protein